MNNLYKNSSNFTRISLVTLVWWPSILFAQEELRPVTRTYALTNATIIQAPGRKIEHGTVIIKDGLILSVNTSATPPPDAVVIKADSLFIYAGFIDGLSHTGVNKPKEEPSHERPKDPGNPTYERAGITPELDVITELSPSEKSIEEMRSIGFTVSQVVPFGNMLPGNGAVILLGGNSVAKMVLSENSALYAELSPVQGAYPSTIIGVMAKWKDLYRQASNSLAYEGLYASNRNGLERPLNNHVLQAFYPVISKKTSVLFKAEKMLDVYRVLALQSELGFPLVLANIKEGWALTDKIKSLGTRVFLSLDLPEDKKDDDKPKEKSDLTKSKETKKDTTIVKVKTAADLEKEALEKRKSEFISKYNGQAAAYQKAGIHFGFSTMGVKPKDVASNLRKIIAAGLSEDEALASLTTYPAQILGLSDRIGTIDNGKMANLVITDKSYFNEKSNIRYVFVDGELYKLEAKDTKKSKLSTATKLEIGGAWTFITETPQGKSDHKVTFKKDGDSWNANVGGSFISNTTVAKGIDLTEDHLKFTYTINVEGTSVDVVVEGKVDGDNFKGTSTAGQFGSFDTTGTKDPKF